MKDSSSTANGVSAGSRLTDMMTDAQLDALLPAAVRHASAIYWTPAGVARRAAQIFVDLGIARVLDVGSGAGKFCVVAGAHAAGLSLVGVEHRPHLVAAAQALAVAVESANVTFFVGDASRLPLADFDGFYIFNSFAENAFLVADQLDQTVELSHGRQLGDVMRVERWLANRSLGTVLVTYHGLGGPIPGSYARVHVEAAGTGWLSAWRKGPDGPRDTYWLEDGADLNLATLQGVLHHLSPDSVTR
jgi:SAM-dependent methyltransferase